MARTSISFTTTEAAAETLKEYAEMKDMDRSEVIERIVTTELPQIMEELND
jgi:hypothetical protein